MSCNPRTQLLLKPNYLKIFFLLIVTFSLKNHFESKMLFKLIYVFFLLPHVLTLPHKKLVGIDVIFTL